MAKKIDTELTEIEKQILIAQDKLSDIDNAINRDQLIAEQKEKNILLLQKEENAIKKNIEQIKQSEIDVWVALNTAQQKSNAKTAEMVSRKAKIQVEIDFLLEKEEKEIEKTWILEKANEKRIKEIAAQYIVSENEYKKKLEKLEEDMKEEENKQKNFINETLIAEAQLQWIYNTIAANKKELEETNHLLSNLIKYKLELEGLEHDISTKATEKLNIDTIIATSNIIIEKLQQEIAALNIELIPLREENKVYVTNKFALKTEREELDQKEAYIKWKYEEAGLSF